MQVQILLSTMKQKNYKILDKLNLKTKAIVVNQTEENKIENLLHNNKEVKFISLNEKGVGLSRNTALMRATEEIIVFADDDVEYNDDYEKVIIEEFKKNQKADIIIFNLISTNNQRPEYIIKKNQKVNYFNCMKYGTFRIAARRERLQEKNIYFSLLFGGGAKYGSGEDTLFLVECLKKGMKLYAVNKTIGFVSHSESTWFVGYNEKYFFDKGVLYYFISKKYSIFLCLQYCIRKVKLYRKEISFFKALKSSLEGVKSVWF